MASVQNLLSFRLGQFASVGVIGAICDNIALLSLVEASLVGPLFGKILSTEFSIIIMFLLNDQWTFRSISSGSLFHRFLKSNAVRIGGFSVGFCILYIFTSWFDVWYLAANILGIGAGFGVNYVMESIYTWNLD